MPQRSHASQEDEALRQARTADDSRAQDALDYARAQYGRARQDHRDQVNGGAEPVPAHFDRR